uniref:L-dopachrome isomerase n=1 Tax=Phaeomonas parva TaxID=124430 RepID=A0A7S1UJE6_9STRA|mmetsp:Transcript_8178/g.23282  ORF Transcript_8178/g.23282 Transcript_8178/m.23282 type:complete len:162 (+) Transcript_8178:52-537(+)
MRTVAFAFALAAALAPAAAFVALRAGPAARHSARRASAADVASLPGDPSLVLTTSVDLGDKKLEVMKALSKAIVEVTGKPESYVAVCVNDNASVIWAGDEAPCALGIMYSIGAVDQENNGDMTRLFTDILEPFGIEENRIYIQFFDMPRSMVGWSRRTFAG